MDFAFDITRVLREPVTQWDKKSMMQIPKDQAQRLRDIVDQMGVASGKAQGLGAPVTSFNILVQCPEQKLYLFQEERKVVGMIKVGVKKLFIRNELDVHKEISPLCVLDFYVHESKQRTGRGKMLFEAMLEREDVDPAKLGYDRPSTKFISFLRRHYDLVAFTPQANNFVVFKKYFDSENPRMRNEQANASVSMRPLTSHKRRNSEGGSQYTQPTTANNSSYTPQKPNARPDNVAPLSLPQNGHNPFSLKANPPARSASPVATTPPTRSQSRTSSPSPYQPQQTPTNNYNDARSDASYHDGDSYRNGNDNYANGFEDSYNHYNGDDTIASEDYNRSMTRADSSPAPPNQPKNAFTNTSSSSYGSHVTLTKQASGSNVRHPSPGPSFNKTHSYGVSPSKVSTGHFALGGSELSNNYSDTPPIRGRSPARQRAESPFAETADLVQTTRPRSQSLEKTANHPPKGLGTLGTFSQSFAHPVKFEKDLADPPQRHTAYVDSSYMPPRREPHNPRSPVYRLGAASNINSREMDQLEQSMRNALTHIDNSEKRLSLINDGGYRAISPERRAPSQPDYQSPQSRSIFSSIQPTGAPPPPRSVSPAKFLNNTHSREEDFSKADYHKKFHNENPGLMSSPPVATRVHPNSRSRQTPTPFMT